MALLDAMMTALLTRLVPSWTGGGSSPQAGYAFVNLGSSFLTAAVGGYITAWASAANPLVHVLALAIVVLAMAALTALQSRGMRPIWFQLALVATSPVGVLAGGLVRLRVLGIW